MIARTAEEIEICNAKNLKDDDFEFSSLKNPGIFKQFFAILFQRSKIIPDLSKILIGCGTFFRTKDVRPGFEIKKVLAVT